jgi:hypothetical protein
MSSTLKTAPDADADASLAPAGEAMLQRGSGARCRMIYGSVLCVSCAGLDSGTAEKFRKA